MNPVVIENTRPVQSARPRKHRRGGSGKKTAAPVEAALLTKLSEAELEEKSEHYRVWTNLEKASRELEAKTMHALIAARKMEEVADSLYETAPSRIRTIPSSGDRFDRLMERVFGLPKPKLAVTMECSRVFQAYKELYISACNEANAYRKKHDVWDSSDITPFDFYKVRL